MQLDKMDADLRRVAERAGDKYGEDFLGSYLSAPEDRRLSMLEGRFDSQEDLDGFLSDVELLENKELSMGKMRAAANKKIVEMIADTRRKNEEETANLEKEFQKIDAFEENGKRSVIEAFLDKYGGRDEVVFVSGAEELEGIFSPEEAEEIMSDIRRKGAYDHKNGKIYLFEPHFKDGVEAFRTLAHERLHWIADKIRQDPSFNGMLNRVLQIMGGGNALRQSLESEYANNNDLDLAEEYIARVCERVALKEVLDENGRSVFKTFKNWIKRIFTTENTAIDIHDREFTDIAKALFNRVNRETQKLYSDDWTATTPEENGPEVGGKYAVLDASEIIASTDGGYDDTLQPRNRARRGSIEQVSKIAAHLNPKRLDSSETTDEGAPIIDAKGQVLSGNGRILAIREAYENNPERGASYRDYVLSRARQMGLNVPIGIKSPVLVRRIENSGGMSLQEFAARSNKQKVASMSNAETAVADARRILEIGTGGGRILDLFFPSDKGDVLSESNTEFINAFLEAVGGREQYIDKNGRIKANLAPRIRAAVLAAMLDPNKRDVIENLLDNPEGWSGLIRGLIGSAANLGKLAGNADYDLSSEMSQAVELYVNLRREGRTYKDYTSQLEMFEPAPSAEVSFLMELFEANVKTPTGISGVLNEYYSLVKNIDTSSVDMFGEGNPPKIAELQKAFERYGGTEHKSDVSWNIRKSDVERFESELQDYIDGKLDNKHVFRLGTTPEVMRLVGAKDLPLELSASTLAVKENKHNLDLESLKSLPVELADPIAIFQSALVPGGLLIFTEIKADNGEKIVAAVHLEKSRNRNIINDIRSIHSRSDFNMQTQADRGLLRYLNTKRKPRSLRPNRVAPVGGSASKALYGNKIFTEADLSQAEKDNIFELRQNNPRFRYSFRDTRSAVELEALDRKHRELYERYKNGDNSAYAEAVRLVAEEAKRKGHEVKVYHGTGSDGFNVADATSKYAENGEGNQAHGAGLYLALSRDTAERYRDNAVINAKKEILSHLRIKGLSLSDILDWKILVDGNQEVLRIMFSEMVENPYIFSFDEYIEIQNDWVKKSDNDYDRAVHNQAKKAIETIKQAFKDKGIRTDDVSVADIKGSFFNWFTNLNKENTLDEDKPLNKQSKTVREAIATYYKSRPDDYHSIKESELGDNTGREFFKDLIFQMRREGAKNPQLEASKLLAKLGIKGLTYNGRQDGRCFVSFEGGATVKLQDPFTFDDNGELIPLSERFNDQNPDMRWSVRDMPSDAEIDEAERQIEEVRATYVNTPQWLNAPNGEPTKLTERQWLQVRTPNFKKWFGDWENDPKNASKVVDENGEPLVVYHGTNEYDVKKTWNEKTKTYDNEYKNFTVFKNKRGNFFNSSKDNAGGYGGNIYDTFLNIKNPLIIDADNASYNAINFDGKTKSTDGWVSEAKSRGFDGVIFNNIRDGVDFGSLEHATNDYVAFNSNQIKSATDNVGTFDSENPDIRWSVRDTPKEFKETINSIVSEIDNIKKNNLPTDTKSLEKRYAKYGNDGNRILDLKVAKLNDKQAEYFGLEDKYIYTSLFDILNHHFNHHPELNETAYFNLPKTIAEAIIVVGGSIKGSYIFGVKLDNWYVSTSFIISNSNKAVLYKNFYITNKPEKVFKKNKIIKELTSWEDWQSSIHPTSNRSKGSASNISALQDINSVSLQSPKSSENQEKNPSNLKYLLRQERRENPLVWASIVLAKDILLGGRITQSKLEKLLPQSEGFDGSNYEYVKDRAVKVAETCRAKKYNAKKDLDQAVQLAESDYHWQSEMVDKIYSSFRKDGEEYGMAKAKVAQWLKDQKLKKLKDIKGYGESDFDADLTSSILQAMEKEPANGFEGQRLSLEELEEVQPDGDSEMEVSEASKPALNKNIRDVISTIKREVLRRSRLADESEGVMREKYRKTLVNILSASANELSYGLEKERILSKISELEKANYAVITIKDGERTGQKIDNFTLRAEHIALRIFNRGVRDDKAELGEKLDKILKSGGTFNKTKRADKRSISADSHEILNYARKVRGLSKEALDAEFDAVSNDLELSGKGYSSELKYNDALWKIEVLKKVGDWREKSRAQMAEAIEWFEKIKEKGIGDAQSLLERHNRENEKNRSVYEESLKAEKDKFRDDGKAPFSSYLNWAVHLADDLDYLASSSNPEAREKARAFSRELSREIYDAGSRRDNEIKRKIENITKILKEVYGEDAQKALKELFAYNDALDKFSTQKVKMNKNRLLQLYASCKQNWYADNVLHFRAKNTKRGLELEKEIASLEERYANPEERAADWKGYKKTWREIEYIFGLNSVRVNAKALGLELDVGDKFYLKRPHKNYGLTWYYSAISTLVTIQSISSDGWISGVAPEFTNSGGSYPAYGFIWAVETAPFYLVVHAKNYPQRSLQVKIKKTTEFFSKVIHNHAPDIYDRFFPTTKSGIEAPEINNSTTPTFSLYQHWINSKKLIEAKPSIVREIYPGLWMRERYQTEAR